MKPERVRKILQKWYEDDNAFAAFNDHHVQKVFSMAIDKQWLIEKDGEYYTRLGRKVS